MSATEFIGMNRRRFMAGVAAGTAGLSFGAGSGFAKALMLGTLAPAGPETLADPFGCIWRNIETPLNAIFAVSFIKLNESQRNSVNLKYKR